MIVAGYTRHVPIKSRLADLRARVGKKLGEAQTAALTRSPGYVPAKPGEEPPVVARLMVEIRSDGSQTIARGAMEDIASGERVAVEARGTTPMQLAASLARTIFATPLLAKTAVRAVLESKRARRSREE